MPTKNPFLYGGPRDLLALAVASEVVEHVLEKYRFFISNSGHPEAHTFLRDVDAETESRATQILRDLNLLPRI